MDGQIDSAKSNTPQACLVEQRPSIGRSSDALQEVMRRRLEACQEFESVPEGSKADVVAASDVVVGVKSTMVFESVPEGSKADVVAACDVSVGQKSAMVFESVPEGSKADVVAASDVAVSEKSTLVFESVPVGSTADALAGSFVGTSSGEKVSRATDGKIRHTSNTELNSWMEQLRGRCEVLESTPESAVADVIATSENCIEKPRHEIVFLPPVAVDHCEDSDNAARWHKRSREELNDWMSRMRDRCAVLESMPTATIADARHEQIEVKASATSSFTPKERHAKQISTTSSPGVSLGAVTSSNRTGAMSGDIAPARERLQAGPLSHAMRAKLWKSHLDVQDDKEEPAIDAKLPQSLLDALSGEAESEDVLFDANEDTPSESMRRRLVSAFCERYLSWAHCIGLRTSDTTRAHASSFFGALAQLLRYHCPSAACSMESVAVAHGLDLAGLMGAAIDGYGLKEFLFAARGDSHLRSLLHICDCIVVEEEELLLLFVIAACLVNIEIDQNATLERVKAELCCAMSLEGVGRTSSPQGCIADALVLLDETPITLMSLLAGGHIDAQLIPTMCTVAPNELLHHIYTKPSRTWRLVVVDARMTSSELVLPVCIRLGRTPHKQRRQVLRDMPYEESIHLCFMGDGLPLPGDDAFELCRHLMGPSVKRKHVSVVEGGWSAVEELARSLKLDLMPAEPPEKRKPPSFKHELKQELKQARAAAREAVVEIAQATENATKASQKVAQRMWAGAGRALQMTSQMLSTDLIGNPQKSASKQPAHNVDV